MTISELESNLRKINKNFEVRMGMHYDIPTAKVYRQGWNFVNIRFHEYGNAELEIPASVYCGISAFDEMMEVLEEVRNFMRVGTV